MSANFRIGRKAARSSRCVVGAILAGVLAIAYLGSRQGDEASRVAQQTRVPATAHSQAVESTAGILADTLPSRAESDGAAPVIEGEPPARVVQGQPYLFEPDAFDEDLAQELSFSITGKPAWAEFEPTTGMLMGVPQGEDVGRYEGIVITVTDGVNQASLGPFPIEVLGSGTGTALLEWTPPVDTVDGSAFPGISGYRIEYGQSPGALLQTINIDNPSVTSYVVENLAPGVWYFRVIVYDGEGLESEPTPVVQRIVG